MKAVLGTVLVFGLAALPAAAGPQSAEGAPQPASPMVLPAGGSYLGVFVAEVDADRAKALKLPDENGVEITRVEHDSPADKAGLRAGDVVLSYNGEKIEGMEQFRRLIRETPAGRHALLTVFRNGATLGIKVVIGSIKPQTFLFHPSAPSVQVNGPEIVGPPIAVPDLPKVLSGSKSVVLGVETEPLSPQLAKFFGVTDGVLIRTVLSGMPAEKAGLRAGDVVVRADDREIDSPWKLSVVVREALANHRVLTLQVVRDKQPLSITASLDR